MELMHSLARTYTLELDDGERLTHLVDRALSLTHCCVGSLFSRKKLMEVPRLNRRERYCRDKHRGRRPRDVVSSQKLRHL